jgi:hypothetical protein
MSVLLGEQTVAIWTTAHDAAGTPEAILSEFGFVPEKRFYVEELANYSVAIVTHRFNKGPRSIRAIKYLRGERTLSIIDERPTLVSIHDVDIRRLGLLHHHRRSLTRIALKRRYSSPPIRH